ncbi:MAG: DUF167 domain-containing protein [Candidatus Omnitrophica bacterium]|nr:DUF167 domain-containing protein [Candidatus Omnitrophota bacterium]
MRIFVKVKPNAKLQNLEKISNNQFLLYTKEPPIDGRANKAVIEILADYFGVSKSQIKIISGFSSKKKYIGVLFIFPIYLLVM